MICVSNHLTYNNKDQMEGSLQPGHPFSLKSQDLQMLTCMQTWWHQLDQRQMAKVLEAPLNNKACIIMFYYLIQKLFIDKKIGNLIYLVDSIERQKFALQMFQQIILKFFSQKPKLVGKLPTVSSQYSLNQQSSQIIVMNFKQFVEIDLPDDNIYNYMIIQTSNFLRTVKDAFSDYITDVHLRRAYIEALKYQQAYKQTQKLLMLNKNTGTLPNLSKKNSQQPPANLVSLISRQQSVQKRQQRQREMQKQKQKQRERERERQKQKKQKDTNQFKKIMIVYQDKKNQLLNSIKDKKQNPIKYFETNELILISSIIYLIGFFHKQLQIKKNRSFADFLEDYTTKTSMSQQYLAKVSTYFRIVYEKCPITIYNNIQQTYLYAFCTFIDKIIRYKKTFLQDYVQLFEFKLQKFPLEKRQSIAEQSTVCLQITCKQNNKICQKLLNRKCIKSLIVQNMGCPQSYWFHIFKKHNMILRPKPQPQVTPSLLAQLSLSHSMSQLTSAVTPSFSKYHRLYGIHISKSPSNQDLNFAEKLRPDIETIKYKACGVLLYDLSKFTPDGIVVYFYSTQALDFFIKEMDKDQEKIMRRIDGNKKIFYESVYEEVNRFNYQKFKKLCQIGRGAIFLLSVNSKAAQYLKFYNHLSRCVVFFGLPRKEGQIKKQLQIRNEQQQQQLQNTQENLQKISIFNECINNCVNSLEEYKSIIFVGREITNDLQDWYKTFIRSWDQTTRESLMKLRNHFQKMKPLRFVNPPSSQQQKK